MKRAILRAKKNRPGSAMAGLLGGLAATVAMSRFQVGWKTLRPRGSEQQPSFPPEEPTDVEGCRAIVRRLASISEVRMSDATVERYAQLMHYGVGAVAGVLYGFAQARASDELPSKFQILIAGAGFGTAIFLAADEVATPALGLKRGSLMGSRVYGVSSHVVYGVVLAEVCDQARALF